MKKENLISLIAICVTILIWCFMLSKTKFSVNTGSAAEHTISVDGDWEVRVTPDTLILNVRVEETAKTTSIAQKQVDEKINKIKDIIKNYKIKDSDVQSTYVNVYEAYDWTDNGRKSLWYTASHELQIKIKWVDTENEWVAGKILSEISEIGWVLVNNISYDVDDKTEYYSQARKLALKKAEQKAEDLAEYAWVKLWKPVSIVEERNYDYAVVSNMKNMAFADSVEEESVMWSDISLGEMKISLNVNVVYEIK